MQTCIVFCAGAFYGLAEAIDESDYIIAADGGLAHLNKLGLQAHCVLGDFDSLGYVPEDCLVFPVEKDDTDSMLAIRHGLNRGFRRFVLYGALEGKRLDHAIANFQALQFLADHGAVGYLPGADTMATLIQNSTLTLPPRERGIVSVFCMGADAREVTIRGLQYGLEQGSLTAGMPLGVSNHFIGEKATISVKSGSLLVLYPLEIGFGEVQPC